MHNIRIKFPNREGYNLYARLELPPHEKPYTCAVFAHCFTCSSSLRPVINIARALTQKGIAVLRFDFTGLGRSEGDFSETTFSTNVADLLSAAEYMEEHFQVPELLIGHSLGGAAVLQAAHYLPNVKAVATIGAPAQPEHVKKQFRDQLDEILEEGEQVVELAGRRFKIRKEFVQDLERYRAEEKIKQLKRALLVLHSPVDRVVGIDNAREIYDNALHPKSFVSLDDADHLLMQDKDSLYAAEMIAAWSQRYLPRPEEQLLPTHRQVVVRTPQDTYTTEINANGHDIIADEPKSVGGNDLGATPYELLIAGLGACTAMTLQMYAKQKKWPLEEVLIHLKYEKVHAQDAGECAENGEEKLIDQITREIELYGAELNDDQRQRLLEIANRCPVHKTLHSPTRIETQLIPPHTLAEDLDAETTV